MSRKPDIKWTRWIEIDADSVAFEMTSNDGHGKRWTSWYDTPSKFRAGWQASTRTFHVELIYEQMDPDFNEERIGEAYLVRVGTRSNRIYAVEAHVPSLERAEFASSAKNALIKAISEFCEHHNLVDDRSQVFFNYETIKNVAKHQFQNDRIEQLAF